jgi:hypothetical protein
MTNSRFSRTAFANGPQKESKKQVAVYTGSAKTGKKNYTTKEERTNANGAEN